jgi:hypothetical protein
MRQIIAKKQQGQPLTPEENDYFKHVSETRRQPQGSRPAAFGPIKRCSLRQVPLMKELLAPEVREKGYEAVFLDVLTAIPPLECCHPDHPLNRGARY